MDYEIVLPEAFYDLKKYDYFRHAVVAGGYLRDAVLGLAPSDLDIFVPTTSLSTFEDYITGTLMKDKDWNFTNYETGRRGYDKAQRFSKFDCTYKGMDIDIMGIRMNVEKFGNNLIESFPWANQQIFHDGKKVFSSKYFDEDIEHGRMTLRNCTGINELSHLMEKYEKLNLKISKERHYFLTFASEYILTKRNGDDWL